MENEDFESPEKDNVDAETPVGKSEPQSDHGCLPRRNTRTILIVALLVTIVVVTVVLGAVFGTRSNDDDDGNNEDASKDNCKPLLPAKRFL
jgi:flagellar basal body-associated protein FliL